MTAESAVFFLYYFKRKEKKKFLRSVVACDYA